jgi:hypothetical protein
MSLLKKSAWAAGTAALLVVLVLTGISIYLNGAFPRIRELDSNRTQVELPEDWGQSGRRRAA